MSTTPAPAPLRERGDLLSISAGTYHAEISTQGAILESLTVGGRDLLVRNPEQGPMLFHRGALVAPWPNRIGDGTYRWDGVELQVPITEIERNNALHGLVSYQAYTVLELTGSAAVLRTELFPTPGYPFRLLLTVRYEVEGSTGLTTTVRAQNLGRADAPYGVCPHPYLVAGAEPLDTWSAQFGAGTVLTVSEERLLPLGEAEIAPGDPLDFAGSRVIGDLALDHAVTDLDRDAEGIARVRVTAPGGTGVELSTGRACPWLQIHTGDRPEPEHHRRGLAVEPMTCPPDAFRSGRDVVRLVPGQEHEASWSIRGW